MTRRTIWFVAIGIIAYLLAIVWTIPASFVWRDAPGIAGTSGTLWRGGALLADGSRLTWAWAPLRSIIGLGFAADWDIVGTGGTLKGRALIRHRSTVIDDTAGGAAGSLLAIIAPDLPFRCDTPLDVVLEHAAIGGDDQALRGEVRSGPGSCAAKTGGTATIVPPLVASFSPRGSGSAILIAPMAARRQLLVDGMLSRGGKLTIRVTPQGGRALPFVAPPGGLAIETAL